MTIGVHYIAFYSQKGLRNAFWVGLCLPKKNFKLASAPKPIISDVVHWWGAASWLWPPCGQLVGEAPPQKSGEKWCLGGDGISCFLFCAQDERKVVSDAVWHGAGIKDKKGPPTPQRPGRKEKTKKRKEGGEKKKQKKKRKTTAPRIPAWSPTVVLTERHSS